MALDPIDDVNLLKDAADLDYQFWRRMVRLGVVTATGIGPNSDISVLIDGQTSSVQVPKNQDVTFSTDDRVLLFDTNGNGGFVAMMRWLI